MKSTPWVWGDCSKQNTTPKYGIVVTENSSLGNLITKHEMVCLERSATFPKMLAKKSWDRRSNR